jgi:ABC-type sugar transport system ATPase subunit
MSGVEFQGVGMRYGAQAVLSGIDIAVAAGELAVFVGPSGCGKSTLLRLLSGLDEPTEGTIRIGGREVNGVPPRNRDVAMVFQSYALYPHMTVAENIGFPLRMAGVAPAERAIRVAEVASILGLESLLPRYPRALSGGQRQRVAMGRAVIREPAVFLFDEPLSNLDASLRAQMRVEILRLHRRLEATMIFVTHDQVEAMTLADRLVVLNGGRVEQAGPPLALYHQPANLFVAGFLGAPAMNLLPAQISAGRLELGPLRWRANLPDGPVTMGLRPENLAPTADGIPARVEVVESLGAEAVLHARTGITPDLVKLRVPAPLALDTPIFLRPDPGQMHLFDTTGNRIDIVVTEESRS